MITKLSNEKKTTKKKIYKFIVNFILFVYSSTQNSYAQKNMNLLSNFIIQFSISH